MNVEQLVDAMTLWGLVASIASIVLAIVAIALTIIFFWLSTKWSKSIETASQDIAGSVVRLEKLFDTMYTDTFTMVKDTVHDMRKHIWPESAEDADADANAELETRLQDQMTRLSETMAERLESVAQGGLTPTQRQQIQGILREGLSEAKQSSTEIVGDAIRDAILRYLISRPMTASDLLERRMMRQFPFDDALRTLEQMIDQGLVATDEGGRGVGPSTELVLTKVGQELAADAIRRSAGSRRRQREAEAGMAE